MAFIKSLSTIFFGCWELLKAIKKLFDKFIIEFWWFHPFFATLLVVKPLTDALGTVHSEADRRASMLFLFGYYIFFFGMWGYKKLIMFLENKNNK